jgi:cytochrome c oxidase accessory protein FixG
MSSASPQPTGEPPPPATRDAVLAAHGVKPTRAQRLAAAYSQDGLADAQLSSVRSDGSRYAIHPLEVKGVFITGRRVFFTLLLALYVLAPVVRLGGHPAVHLDVETRRFYLFGGTFNAQDFWLVLPLVIGFLFTGLFVTAWRGRLWCGWACPQTVFLEALYRPLERLFDGPRERRIKLANAPWTPLRVMRETGKHLSYLLLSIALAHVATSLFTSIHDLKQMILDGPAASPVAFAWTTAITLLLYGNFAWFREQFCVVMCPYGRLQSVLHDRETVTVYYDVDRGEPRGKLVKNGPPSAGSGQAGGPLRGSTIGDCVDCKKCVQACPTAIDIRNGLQMECVACAQCADACDDVMSRIGRPKGLIRYASQAELTGTGRHVLRPRVVLYAALASLAFGTLGFTLVTRTPYEANVLRLAGVPYVLEGERVRNQFEVHLVNKAPQASDFALRVRGPDGLDVQLATPTVHVESLEQTRVPLVLSLPRERAKGRIDLDLIVTSGGVDKHAAIPFVGPR